MTNKELVHHKTFMAPDMPDISETQLLKQNSQEYWAFAL